MKNFKNMDKLSRILFLGLAQLKITNQKTEYIES